MMDIKDVNNGLLNLLQANRANLQGTAVNTTGFGDLLAGLESEKTPSVEVRMIFARQRMPRLQICQNLVPKIKALPAESRRLKINPPLTAEKTR